MRIIIDLHPALDDVMRAMADQHHHSVREEASELVTRVCEAEALRQNAERAVEPAPQGRVR
jgi:plasmid stability protein